MDEVLLTSSEYKFNRLVLDMKRRRHKGQSLQAFIDSHREFLSQDLKSHLYQPHSLFFAWLIILIPDNKRIFRHPSRRNPDNTQQPLSLVIRLTGKPLTLQDSGIVVPI